MGVQSQFKTPSSFKYPGGGGPTSVPVTIPQGGTGATSAGAARTALGVPAIAHSHAATDITSAALALARGGTHADLSATGGATHFLRQASTGADVTVGAIGASDLPTGIDAAKIGGGGVTTAEFDRLDATSSIQTQLDGKAASSHTHAASDIASGALALARGGTNADLSATGGATHVVRQASTGANLTVGALAASDIPSLGASKITSEAFNTARLAGGTATSGYVPKSNGDGTSTWGAEGGSDYSGALLGVTTAQAQIATNTPTDIKWDTNIIISNGSIHDASSNEEKIYPETDGVWQLDVEITAVQGVVDQIYLQICKNTTVIRSTTIYLSGSPFVSKLDLSMDADMLTSDYFKARAYCGATTLDLLGKTSNAYRCIARLSKNGAN